MSNYSENPQHCRVDIWKHSGNKWNMTIVLDWDEYTGNIHHVFRRLMKEQYPQIVSGRATCLEPYHEHSHPIPIDLSSW